jgi:hypothetical protein
MLTAGLGEGPRCWWARGLGVDCVIYYLTATLPATRFCSTGICTFDPGFGSTASCESSITYIDGNKGILLYRG